MHKNPLGINLNMFLNAVSKPIKKNTEDLIESLCSPQASHYTQCTLFLCLLQFYTALQSVFASHYFV